MSRHTLLARSFFFASLALLLTFAFAPSSVFAVLHAEAGEAAVEMPKRPPAPAGCEGITTPVCAEAELGGFVFKYYFKP